MLPPEIFSKTKKKPFERKKGKRKSGIKENFNKSSIIKKKKNIIQLITTLYIHFTHDILYDRKKGKKKEKKNVT